MLVGEDISGSETVAVLPRAVLRRRREKAALMSGREALFPGLCDVQAFLKHNTRFPPTMTMLNTLTQETDKEIGGHKSRKGNGRRWLVVVMGDGGCETLSCREKCTRLGLSLWWCGLDDRATITGGGGRLSNCRADEMLRIINLMVIYRAFMRNCFV